MVNGLIGNNGKEDIANNEPANKIEVGILYSDPLVRYPLREL
jgi:hypothetical protein